MLDTGLFGRRAGDSARKYLANFGQGPNPARAPKCLIVSAKCGGAPGRKSPRRTAEDPESDAAIRYEPSPTKLNRHGMETFLSALRAVARLLLVPGSTPASRASLSAGCLPEPDFQIDVPHARAPRPAGTTTHHRRAAPSSAARRCTATSASLRKSARIGAEEERVRVVRLADRAASLMGCSSAHRVAGSELLCSATVNAAWRGEQLLDQLARGRGRARPARPGSAPAASPD